jgi:hypothetical protein
MATSATSSGGDRAAKPLHHRHEPPTRVLEAGGAGARRSRQASSRRRWDRVAQTLLDACREIGVVLDPPGLGLQHLLGLLLHRVRVAQPVVEVLVDLVGVYGMFSPRVDAGTRRAAGCTDQPARPADVLRHAAPSGAASALL